MTNNHLNYMASACVIKKYSFNGKRHIFEVKNLDGNSHTVIIQMSCDCQYMGKSGIANGRVCSELAHVLKVIASKPSSFQQELDFSPLQTKRNLALSYFRPSSRKPNTFRYGKNETQPNIDKKRELYDFYRNMGCWVLCEGIFDKRFAVNGKSGRCDLAILDQFKFIEVADSESEESLEEKRSYYPSGWEFITIRVKEKGGK